MSDILKEFAKFILKLLFDWDLRNELWSEQKHLQMAKPLFYVGGTELTKTPIQVFYHRQSMRRYTPFSGTVQERCIYKKLKTCSVGL
jgi:hypothetical protein